MITSSFYDSVVIMKTRNPQNTWNVIAPTLLKKYKRSATFLNYNNPWELTVAVILSAQSTDDGVNKITPALFAKYPTPADMGNAPIVSITKLISSVNYKNAKARYLKASGKIVTTDFGGVVPGNEIDLQKLPGVGRKSAVAILANGFKKYVGIPTDTHVIRFAKRFKLSRYSDASKIESDLLQIISKKDWNRAGYAIKEYGRREGRARGYRRDQDPLWQTFDKI